MNLGIWGIGAVLAMLLTGPAALAEEKKSVNDDDATMQDDIVVKAGTGGNLAAAGMEWTVKKRKAIIGTDRELRDDVQGEIDYFTITDTRGASHKAEWVEFVVEPAGGKRTIRITRINRNEKDHFEWTYPAGPKMESCVHNQTCTYDGIPRFMTFPLVRRLIGKTMGGNAALPIHGFEMKGK